jgi:hypothetical protein
VGPTRHRDGEKSRTYQTLFRISDPQWSYFAMELHRPTALELFFRIEALPNTPLFKNILKMGRKKCCLISVYLSFISKHDGDKWSEK